MAQRTAEGGPRSRRLARCAAVALAAACLGCGPGEQAPAPPAESPAGEPAAAGDARHPGSPDARPDLTEFLQADLEAPRHPSDGGGRAWLESAEPVEAAPGGGDRGLVAGRPARFRIGYEAGPLGVAEGGALFLQSPPFWNWDPPQVTRPDARGFTAFETDAAGVELAVRELDRGLVLAEIRGRALEAGERVHIDYGGPAGARVDTYAERRTRLWIAVDGDGDGVRALVADPPAVDIVAGPPARLRLTLPTTRHPGESVRLALAVLDARGNAGVPFEGTVRLVDTPDGLELPERIELEARHGGTRTIEGRVREPGVYRVRGETTAGAGTLAGESNPLIVADRAPRVLWGDLHGHSQLSDGTGTPDDYYAYARDVAALDVAALTDHDHWGMVALDTHPQPWAEIQAAAERHHEPGRFVTLLGYEWTSWLYGHRHVLFFGDEAALWSSLDATTETPSGLWDAIRSWEEESGTAALTFAHHSAGGPIATDWSFVPDPRVEPVTEVVSVHGSSEAADSPGGIYKPVPGNYVRDVLDRGLRFGFIGSGDSHDGHPGLPQLNAPSGGLAAILSDDLTREGVLSALRARRVYATNGPRILLRFSLDGHPMGTTLPAAETEPAAEDAGAAADAREQTLDWAVAGTGPVARVELVRSGQIVASLEGEGRRELSGRVPLPALGPGEYVYLRVVQDDGGLAWSSPVYQD